MSRLGKKPIEIVDKVTVSVEQDTVHVAGPLGKLSRRMPSGIAVTIEGKAVTVARQNEEPRTKENHGLARALVNNMVLGVSQGYKKDLEIQGVGYRASITGEKLVMQLGFSHPVEFQVPHGIKIVVEKQTQLQISGFDRELVGAVAAQIRQIKPPEPYQGKGIRYAGEHIIKKAGKAAAGAAGGAAGGKK